MISCVFNKAPPHARESAQLSYRSQLRVLRQQSFVPLKFLFGAEKTRLAAQPGHPFSILIVSLLLGSTFPSYIYKFASSGRVDSGQGETISACASAVASGKGPIKPLVKIDSVGRVILLVSLHNFSAPLLRHERII